MALDIFGDIVTENTPDKYVNPKSTLMPNFLEALYDARVGIALFIAIILNILLVIAAFISLMHIS